MKLPILIVSVKSEIQIFCSFQANKFEKGIRAGHQTHDLLIFWPPAITNAKTFIDVIVNLFSSETNNGIFVFGAN